LYLYCSAGKVLTDFIPELVALVGEQPMVMDVGPVESLKRFEATLSRFIQGKFPLPNQSPYLNSACFCGTPFSYYVG
jgi:hypothetical protein